MMGTKQWIAAVVLLLAGTSGIAMQRATELYAPIGESPGLSDGVTIIGTIASVDEATRTITVTSETEHWTAQITDKTHIWLDRSKTRKTNDYGHFSDLSQGERVEVLYAHREERGEGPAEWIKIEKSE
jgi:hypothetical protein